MEHQLLFREFIAVVHEYYHLHNCDRKELNGSTSCANVVSKVFIGNNVHRFLLYFYAGHCRGFVTQEPDAVSVKKFRFPLQESFMVVDFLLFLHYDLEYLTICMMTICVSYIYGVQKLSDDIHFFSGSQPPIFYKVCWYILPAILTVRGHAKLNMLHTNLTRFS